MPKVRVRVIEKDGEFYVDPPSAFVEKSDRLIVFNRTRETMVVHVPDPALFGTTKVESVLAGKKVALDVGATVLDNTFTYQVMMVQSGKKAKGNSDPEIIVDN